MERDYAGLVRRYMKCEMTEAERGAFLSALACKKTLALELANFQDAQTMLLLEVLRQIRESPEFFQYREALLKMWIVGTRKRFMLPPLDNEKRAEMAALWAEEKDVVTRIVRYYWKNADEDQKQAAVTLVFLNAYGTLLAFQEQGFYEERGMLRQFFRTVAYRISRDLRRQERKTEPHFEPFGDQLPASDLSGYEEEGFFEEEQRRLRLLCECVEQLPLMNQAIYQMVFVERIAQEETAARIGISYDALRNRLVTIRNSITHCIKLNATK